MSDDIDDVVENIKQGSTWLRILFMLGFCVVLYVVGVVVFVLTLAQALFSVFTGSDNRNLRLLGSSIAEYVSQVLYFVTYNSELRPFPFTPFPDAKEVAVEVKTDTPKEKKAPAKKKPAARKKPAAKKKTTPAKPETDLNDEAD